MNVAFVAAHREFVSDSRQIVVSTHDRESLKDLVFVVLDGPGDVELVIRVSYVDQRFLEFFWSTFGVKQGQFLSCGLFSRYFLGSCGRCC